MKTGTHSIDRLKARAATHGITLWSQHEHYIAYAQLTDADFMEMDFDAFFNFTQAVDFTFVGEADSYVELQAKLKGNNVIAPVEATMMVRDGLWFEKNPA
jgi:hypothetical protein